MKASDIKKLDTPPLRYGSVPSRLMKFRSLIVDACHDSDGYCFGLRNGFICELSETHQIMGTTIEDCLRGFRFVEPCAGECCKAAA